MAIKKCDLILGRAGLRSWRSMSTCLPLTLLPQLLQLSVLKRQTAGRGEFSSSLVQPLHLLWWNQTCHTALSATLSIHSDPTFNLFCSSVLEKGQATTKEELCWLVFFSHGAVIDEWGRMWPRRSGNASLSPALLCGCRLCLCFMAHACSLCRLGWVMSALCKISACAAILVGWTAVWGPFFIQTMLIFIGFVGSFQKGTAYVLLLYHSYSFAGCWMLAGLILYFFHSFSSQYMTSEVDGPGKRLYPCFLAGFFLFK